MLLHLIFALSHSLPVWCLTFGVWHPGSDTDLNYLMFTLHSHSFQYPRLVVYQGGAISSALALQSHRFGFFWGSLHQCSRYLFQVSSSLPHVRNWLLVVPSSALGLHLHDREFCLCLQYWLGIPLSGAVTCSVCGVDTNGSGNLIYHHGSLRDILYSSASSAALASRKEYFSLIQGSSSRPAKIFLPQWDRGQPVALDVTVISLLQLLTINEDASSAGYALSEGEITELISLAADLLASALILWSSRHLVVGVLGPFKWSGISASCKGQGLEVDQAVATRHLFQRLSVTLWCGNANLYASRESGLTSFSPSVDSIRWLSSSVYFPPPPFFVFFHFSFLSYQ